MLAAAGALAALMLAAWLLSLRLRDVSIVDPVWGLACGLVAWIACGLGGGDQGRRLLLALLTTAWSLRLAIHLGIRKLREPGEDFQGGATGEASLGALDVIGAGVWAVGLAFEAIGDWQLARFRADPANGNAVMDAGLWRYTRHPNYFGDFTVWWGLYLIALAGGAWWSVAGPLVMSLLLIRVSGKELLERSLRKRRPGYDAYVARTSGFFPLPPRRASG